MNVHPICKNDYEKLHDLYTQLIEEESDINDMIQVFEEITGDDHYMVLGVYDDNDVLCGTGTLSRCLDLTGTAQFYYSMENFVIDAEHRHQGYGSFLLKALEEYAISQNAHYICFLSSSKRTGAHAFYEKSGYQRDYVKGFKKRFF